MMRLLSWNVQWCRGVDGVVDPARIAGFIKSQSPDIACLQEVAVNFPDLPGSAGEDQVEALARALPGYEPCFGAGVDLPGVKGGRSRFGNLILSRLPVERVLRHLLPWPASPDTPSMPRVAVEAVIGGLRVITTHLEYHQEAHRAAQIGRLREVNEEALLARQPSDEPTYRSPRRPPSALVCGDFNIPSTHAQHGAMLAAGFVDAWQALNPGKPHPPTFRIYERKEGVAPYCCDYFFVTPDLVPRLKAMNVDGKNQFSDHQPVILDLRLSPQ